MREAHNSKFKAQNSKLKTAAPLHLTTQKSV